MKALIAILFMTLVYVSCTRKDDTTPPAEAPTAPTVELAPPAVEAAPPADATAPAPAADPHAGHGHAHGEEHK